MCAERSFATLDVAREIGAAVSAYGCIITIIRLLLIDFVVFMSEWYVNLVEVAFAKKQRRPSKQPSQLQIRATC